MFATHDRPALISLVDVSKVFESTPPVHALRSVNLTIGGGEYVAIVGPSGSGKSTLLNVVGLLDRPSNGKYLLDGRDVTSLRDSAQSEVRGELIGFIFQAFHLIPQRSVLENVMLAGLYRGRPRMVRRERAMEALDRVGVVHRASFRPDRISGGERQRVAAARALAADPSILLCDEPTGNLDTVNTESMLSLFDELVRDGMTICVITHDADVATRAGRRVSIVDGAIVGDIGRAVPGTIGRNAGLSVDAARHPDGPKSGQ